MTDVEAIYTKIHDVLGLLIKFHQDQSEVLFSLRYIDKKITGREYDEQHSLLDGQLKERLIEAVKALSWEEQIYFMAIYVYDDDIFGPFLDEDQMTAARLMRA